MDWPVKLSFFLTIFFSCLASSVEGNICGKAWVPLSSNADIQNGKILEVKKSSDGQPDKVLVKDFKGNLVKEIEVPRKIDNLNPVNSAGGDLVYASNGRIYHFDTVKKREHEIQFNNQSTCESSDTSVVVSCGKDGEKRFAYDFKTQKQIDLPGNKFIQTKGQLVAAPENTDGTNSFSKISLYDFSTSQKVTFNVPQSKNIQVYSENYIKFAREGGHGRMFTHLVKVDGRWIKYTDTKNRNLTGVLSTGELMYLNIRHKSGKDVEISQSNFNDFEMTTEIYDKTGTQKKNTLDGYYISNFSGGKGIIKFEMPMKMSGFSEESFKEVASGKDVKPQIVTTTSFPYISKSGKWGLQIDSNKGETTLVNLSTGKSFKLPYMSSGSVEEPESGSNVKVGMPAGNTYIVDTETGYIRSFESKGIATFDKNFVNWFHYGNGYESIEEVCFPDVIKVIDDDCGCLIKNADNGQFTNDQNIKYIKDIALASMCQSDGFNTQDWDKITPPITKGEISHQQAFLYLKRFQKIGGYNPNTHFSILSAILRSDIVEKSPAIVNETLKTLSVVLPTLVRSIYNVLKIDKRLPTHYPTGADSICRSNSEKYAIEQKIQNLKSITAMSEIKTTTENWLEYKPFKEEFQKLPKEQRDAMVDSIAESISQNASLSSDLSGIFQSKLYYFSKKFALDLMGDNAKSATDLAVAVRNGKHIPIILGSGHLQEAVQSKMEDTVNSVNPFGFSYKTLEPIAVPENAKVGDSLSKKVSWTHESSPYAAEAKITVLEPLGELIPKYKFPNYSALKKDGKLTGMMVVGTNASAGQAWVVDEFLTYYQNAGFEFKKPKPVDTISFFKNSVQNGQLDYLIKEAHSDGDERNLFRANKFGKLYEGSLIKKDGSKEVIYLLAPDAEKNDSKLITNQEFGSWIRSRGKDQPLVYFNASCTSTRKVISEIAAAHSSNFIPIPSSTPVLFFNDSKKYGTRQMLQAFREGKSYDDMRAALQKSESYIKGQDHFIFPDEKDYDEQIRKNLIMNLDVEVSVKDKAGNEVHIDQNIDH